MQWYQMFEYAVGHWFQKATEHVMGCVLCSPGCFSLFRGEALMAPNVMNTYTTCRFFIVFSRKKMIYLLFSFLQSPLLFLQCLPNPDILCNMIKEKIAGYVHCYFNKAGEQNTQQHQVKCPEMSRSGHFEPFSAYKLHQSQIPNVLSVYISTIYSLKNQNRIFLK